MKKILEPALLAVNRLSAKWIMAVSVLVYLGLTFTSPFSDHHQLLNLEPYPDGLYYINSALNIAQTGQFKITYQDQTLSAIITPVYAYILAIGFLFTRQPGIFYVVNIILGVCSLALTLLTIRLMTKQNWILILGSLIYLSHFILLWLPSVPMAENAILTIFAGAVYSYFRFLKKVSWVNLCLTIVLICGLVFCKYTAVGPAGMLGLALLINLISRKAWNKVGVMVGLFVLAGGLFLFTQQQAGFNPLFLFSSSQQLRADYQAPAQQLVFYSVRYLWPNTVQYAKALMGVFSPPGQFLWLMAPLTSIGLVLTFLIGTGWLWLKGHQQSALFMGLFLAQFPLLLIFYVVDQRYIILSAPLITLGLCYLVDKIKHKKLIVAVIGLSLLIQVLTQVQVLKILIADNLLQRSTAWQYQAIKSLNTQLPAHSYLITVLPPLFVDLYSTHQYTLLPLSVNQEFLNKDQFIWGDQVQYHNLLATYQELLQQGQAVYLTNAYLSSQHSFQTDFDQVMNNFETKKVGEGCLDTCDLYQLQLKSTTF